MDPIEAYRVKNANEASVLGYEWEYLQYRVGNLSYLPLEQWRIFMNGPGFRADVWEPNKWLLSDEFVRFVEGEVFVN